MKLTRRTLLAAMGASPLAAGARRLVVPLATEPAGLIPGLNEQPACRLVGTKLYQGLLRFTAALAPAPELAVAWTVSSDGLRHSFALRPGVTWHDGAAFTADDVVFSVGFHRRLSPRLAPLLERVAAVKAVGDLGVNVTLAAPFEGLPFLLDAASLPIVPRHVHDRPGFALDPRQTPSVGTGPFRLASWLRLTAFAGFAGPPPGLDELAFPILPDMAARLAATRAGQPVLLAGDALGPALIPRLRQQGMLVTGEVTPNHAALAWLDLNHDVPPLGDERVRRALAGAVDRDVILREVWAGFGRVASGPVPLGTSGPGLPPYDPRAAAQLLNAAGLPPDKQGIRLRLRHLAQEVDPWPALAASLQRSLSQVGVELTPEIVDPAAWAARAAARGYDTTGRMAEYGGEALLDPAARKRLIDQAAQIWLVEPSLPVAADRRFRAPGGVCSSFADATLTT